jgi:hypothetical protein
MHALLDYYTMSACCQLAVLLPHSQQNQLLLTTLALCCCCTLLHCSFAAQTTQITIYQFCNYQGQAGVASAGNYASLQSPVRLGNIQPKNFKLILHGIVEY